VADSGTERAIFEVTFDFITGGGALAVLMRMVVYEGRIFGGVDGVDGDGDGVGDAIAVVANALMARMRVVDFIVAR
jgi:hypothetical protein